MILLPNYLSIIREEHLSQDHMSSTDQSLAKRNETAITDFDRVPAGHLIFSSSSVFLSQHVHYLAFSPKLVSW